jgi:hypothetical protein
LPRLERGFSLFSAHQNLGSDIQSNVSPTKKRSTKCFSFFVARADRIDPRVFAFGQKSLGSSPRKKRPKPQSDSELRVQIPVRVTNKKDRYTYRIETGKYFETFFLLCHP